MHIARGSAYVTAGVVGVRLMSKALPCPFGVRIDVVKDISLVPGSQGGASKAPGAAVEKGCGDGTCRRGSGCGKIAAAVGKGRCGCKRGEYRNSYSFSFSLLLLFNVFNRDLK